ncbi:uncharacterized protein LOC34618598 [Cyclospora cayetanensis]|uniref:Uncharacterized protein LOC34618598 n=1 Tax=Cyclospora cayetanensis TaxID=88456 RepID=A0A6P6RS68_9EIME|nr:uncharacterized protein LOC34618598 [Cyclospora cayetanensis]
MRITVRPPGPVKCLFAVILAFSCFSWESLWGSHATGISRGPPTIQEGPIQTNYEAATAVGFAHRVPLWCKAFALEKAFSVCRGSNCKADNTSVLTQVFQDGACVLLILLMLILVADQVEWLLCQVGGPVFTWPQGLRGGNRCSNGPGDPDKLLKELTSLQHQKLQLQQQQQQFSPTADFAAYTRLQRRIDQLERAKEACSTQLQQQQQQHRQESSTKKLLFGVAYRMALRPLARRAVKVLLIPYPSYRNSDLSGSPGVRMMKTSKKCGWDRAAFVSQPLICWWVLSSVFGATIELPTAQIAPLLRKSPLRA